MLDGPAAGGGADVVRVDPAAPGRRARRGSGAGAASDPRRSAGRDRTPPARPRAAAGRARSCRGSFRPTSRGSPAASVLEGVADAGRRRRRASRRRGGDLGDRRDGRDRQDRAGGALGAPGRRPVPRRAALRQPARLRPVRRRRGAGGGDPRLPGRAGCAAGRGSRPIPMPSWGCTARCWPAGGCWWCSTTPATSEQVRPLLPGSPTLPGAGDQPRPAHRAGRRRGGPAADPRPALRRRGPRPARRPVRPGPDRRRTGGGRGDRRPLRRPAAGAGRRRRPASRPVAAAGRGGRQLDDEQSTSGHARRR